MGKSDATPDFKCENSSIPVTKEFDMLGITIDNKLKFFFLSFMSLSAVQIYVLHIFLTVYSSLHGFI